MGFGTNSLEKAVKSMLDHGSRVQAPAIAKYVRHLREEHPDESPAEIVERIEKMYLLAVIGSGGAVGAAAAFPGIGTLTSLAAAGAETAFFLEASAVYTLAVAAVHGVAPEDNEHRKALVLAVALGDSGMDVVQKAVGSQAKNWGTLMANRIPGVAQMNDSLLKRFLVRFATRRLMLLTGKILPAGIGAAIGAFGNRALGKGVVANAHKAFGPAPATWPQAPLIIDPAPEKPAITPPKV